MVVKAACVLALAGVLLVVSSPPTVCVEPVTTDATDFDAACSRARQDLREGRCDEAMTAVTALEDEVRASVEREPGRELGILMIKARAYWNRMDTEGLERFLTQFENDYADTSAADWVRRAAWYERMLGYRFAEDLPRAAQAFETYRELEEQSAGGPSAAGGLDTAARDFDLHVRMPAEIGDLYRYMGRTDLALERYRSALGYATAHSEIFRRLEEHPDQLLGAPASPAQYREEILPTVIRECEAPSESALAVLGRRVACEVEQADWLLSVGRACSQRRAIDSAQRHYRQAWETHEVKIDSLAPADKARYLALRERIPDNVHACDQALTRLRADAL